MRKLTSEELERSKKGAERLRNIINTIQQSLNYNKDAVENNKTNRDFKAKWAPHLRTLKEVEEQKLLEVIEVELKSEQGKLEILEDQIKNGVEVKQP